VISDKSQGSAAARLRCGGLFIYDLFDYIFIAKFGSEINFKIGECLAKLQAKKLIALCALFTLL